VAFAGASKSRQIPTRLRRSTAALAIFTALALVALTVVGLDPSALCALPALALPALLALRRYPGERTLAVALHESRRDGRQRRRLRVCRASPPRVAVPRGGLLLACSLAVRPPPRMRLAAA
jgi:hypothetical protein